MRTKVVAITGSPGTGKTTLADTLQRQGFQVFRLEEIAHQTHALSIENGENVVDTTSLANWSWNEKQVCFIDGHLSHHCSIDAAIVLRCKPNVLRQRLEQREDYSADKIRENLEWELLAGTWSDLLNLHPKINVLEIDTTTEPISITKVLEFLDAENTKATVENCIQDARDWMDTEYVAESI